MSVPKLSMAVLAAMLTACGGGGDAPAATPPATPASAAAEPPPTATPDAVNGRALYLQHCSACHQTTPDDRVRMAAGDGSVIVQTIGLVRIMNFLAPTIRPVQAQDIALWLEDPR